MPSSPLRHDMGVMCFPSAIPEKKPAYLRAYDAYHREGAPWISWVDALDFHLQHGVVISRPECFVMARRVCAAWPDAHHLSLHAALPDETTDGWHVWCAAGGLDDLLELARRNASREITFQRRNERLHRVATKRLGNGNWEMGNGEWI